MLNQSLVSVIVAVFNGEEFIATALESIISQEYGNMEIIVIDDGSTDRTCEIVGRFGSHVSYLQQENAGTPAAHNHGLMAAKGEFITFLDADDVYEPGALRLQLEKLKMNQSVEIVIGQQTDEEISSAPGEPLAFKPIQSTKDIVMTLGASLFRRSAFDRVGIFDESLRYCHDWDWFMRAREMGVPMLLHREAVLRRRLHMQNLTRDRTTGEHYMALMLKRSIERRRKASGEAQLLAPLSASLEVPASSTDQSSR